MFRFFKSKRQPKKPLVVFGTDFGSYQINRVIEASDEFDVIGFISDDPWQRKSSFGKVGVFYSSELIALCEREMVIAILIPSDQKDEFKKNAEEKGWEYLDERVKYFDVLKIPQNPVKKEANKFLAELLNGPE